MINNFARLSAPLLNKSTRKSYAYMSGLVGMNEYLDNELSVPIPVHSC